MTSPTRALQSLEANLETRNLASGRDAFADALAHLHALQSRDDDGILAASRTLCLHSGRPSELAVVLFHGFTNSPAQYARFAAMLCERGCNVLVPRLPGHGDANRMTTRLEPVTAQQYLSTALEATRIGSGLGQRLAVSGISLGGLLCAWLTSQTTGIHRSVIVSPNFALPHLSFSINKIVVQAMRRASRGFYLWWDPKRKEELPPRHGYPRYPVRALGECFGVGISAISSQAQRPRVNQTHTTFVVNADDPAVNNDVTRRIAAQWRESSGSAADFVTLDGLPPIHDIIEPEGPKQRIDLVYPKLIDQIFRETSIA